MLKQQTFHGSLVALSCWLRRNKQLGLDLSANRRDGRRRPRGIPQGGDLPLRDDVDSAKVRHPFADGTTEFCAFECSEEYTT